MTDLFSAPASTTPSATHGPRQADRKADRPPPAAPVQRTGNSSEDVAADAATEFKQRQARARELVAEDKLTAEAADGLLRPWLAIAAAAGAVLPELMVTALRIRPLPVEDITVRLSAHEICPREQWAEALRKALAAAKPGPARDRLIVLAVFFRISPKPETAQ